MGGARTRHTTRRTPWSYTRTGAHAMLVPTAIATNQGKTLATHGAGVLRKRTGGKKGKGTASRVLAKAKPEKHARPLWGALPNPTRPLASNG